MIKRVLAFVARVLAKAFASPDYYFYQDMVTRAQSLRGQPYWSIAPGPNNQVALTRLVDFKPIYNAMNALWVRMSWKDHILLKMWIRTL